MIKVEIVDGKLNIDIERGIIDNIKRDNNIEGGLTLAEIKVLLQRESYIVQMLEDLVCDSVE